MEREKVRNRQHVVLGRRVLDAELAKAIVGDERVVGHDLHAEPDRAAGHLLADPAEAEHAERLPFELDAAPLGALPAMLLQRRVGLRDVAGERDHQPDRLLGGRDDRRLGRVRNDDPAPGRGLDVDVVDTDAGAADHLQVGRELDQLGGELRRGADHDRVVAVDDLGDRRRLILVDLELRAQQLDPRIGDRLPHEDAHRQAAVSYAARAAAPAAPRSSVAPISTSWSSIAPNTVVMSNTST